MWEGLHSGAASSAKGWPVRFRSSEHAFGTAGAGRDLLGRFWCTAGMLQPRSR